MNAPVEKPAEKPVEKPVQKNLLRAGFGILLFVLFIFLAVELQIKRLQEQEQRACGTASETCVRARIALARWYTPINDAAKMAGERAFKEIAAGEFSAAKQHELYWLLRTSIYGSRSFISPEAAAKKSKLLEKIDLRLGISKGLQLKKAGGEEPNYGFQLAAQICFFSWILFVILAVWRGMSNKGEIFWGACIRFLGAAVLAFCSWLFCLSYA